MNVLPFTLLFITTDTDFLDFADGSNTNKHADITKKITGCAMKVHRCFGMGFPEAVYRRALIIELGKRGLKCRAEVEKDIYYEGHFIAKRRLDLLMEDKVLVERKAISELGKAGHNKIINYLCVFKIEVGLLLNFGAESLPYKRFINTKHKQ